MIVIMSDRPVLNVRSDPPESESAIYVYAIEDQHASRIEHYAARRRALSINHGMSAGSVGTETPYLANYIIRYKRPAGKFDLVKDRTASHNVATVAKELLGIELAEDGTFVSEAEEAMFLLKYCGVKYSISQMECELTVSSPTDDVDTTRGKMLARIRAKA